MQKMNQYLLHIYNFPDELTKLRDQFLKDWQEKRGITDERKKELQCAINQLYLFLTQKQIIDLKKLNQTTIIQFQYHLYSQYYSSWMVYRKIKDLNLYFGYLYHNEIIYTNPFTGIKLINPPDKNVDKIKRYYNFDELIRLWINWHKKKNIHHMSIMPKIKSIKLFIKFLEERGIKTVYKITPDTLEEYQKYLTTYKYNRYGEANTDYGAVYNPFMQVNKIRHVCQFLLFLWRQKLIKTNPTDTINLKKQLRELNTKVWPSISGQKTAPITGIKTEWDELIDKFIDYQLSRGGSKWSVKNYQTAIKLFYKYCLEKNKTELARINKRDLIDYQSWLYHTKNTKNQKYSSGSIFGHTANLRSFFIFLVKYDYLTCDPSSAIDLPKKEEGIPHTCMTEREIKILLNQPDTNTPVGIRDMAAMEILYSTGIRINELVNVKTNDIDFNEGLIRINTPKGGKNYQRVVPIGRTACHWAQKYIKEARNGLKNESANDSLFLSLTGRTLTAGLINCGIKRHLFKAGIRKRITAHSFRVSCATHMLKNDADIRYVQQQLGHTSIRTTQKYTRLLPKDLKAVHQKCHPSEKQSMI